MIARDGISAWIFENLMKFMVWWHGAVTFEELKNAADKTLQVEEPSDLDGIRMFSKWLAHSYYSEDMDIAGIISTFGRLDLSDEPDSMRISFSVPSPYVAISNGTLMSIQTDINCYNNKYDGNTSDKPKASVCK